MTPEEQLQAQTSCHQVGTDSACLECLACAQYEAGCERRARARVESELAAAHSALGVWREAVANHRRELTTLRAQRDGLREMVADLFSLRNTISDDVTAHAFGKSPSGEWCVWHEDYPEDGSIVLSPRPASCEEKEVGT